MSLGENIRQARKAAGLSQEALGEALGVVSQTVSKWERDESSPDAALLPELANTLGVSLDRLFGRQTREYMDAATAVRDWLLSVRKEDRWMEALRLGPRLGRGRQYATDGQVVELLLDQHCE